MTRCLERPIYGGMSCQQRKNFSNKESQLLTGSSSFMVYVTVLLITRCLPDRNAESLSYNASKDSQLMQRTCQNKQGGLELIFTWQLKIWSQNFNCFSNFSSHGWSFVTFYSNNFLKPPAYLSTPVHNFLLTFRLTISIRSFHHFSWKLWRRNWRCWEPVFHLLLFLLFFFLKDNDAHRCYAWQEHQEWVFEIDF